jgi:hypothetical protein
MSERIFYNIIIYMIFIKIILDLVAHLTWLGIVAPLHSVVYAILLYSYSLLLNCLNDFWPERSEITYGPERSEITYGPERSEITYGPEMSEITESCAETTL